MVSRGGGGLLQLTIARNVSDFGDFRYSKIEILVSNLYKLSITLTGGAIPTIKFVAILVK